MAQRVDDTSAKTIDDILTGLQVDLGVSRKDILAALKLTGKDIANWQPSGNESEALRRLGVLVQLRDGLQEMFAGPEGVREWMHAELRDLQWRTPQQALQAGDADGAYAAFVGLAAGIYL